VTVALHSGKLTDHATQDPPYRGLIVSRESSLKEEIGWLKVVFGLLIAVDISLISWASKNFRAAEPVILGAALFAIVLTTTVVYRLNAAAFHRIRQLEDT
jgi:hypothetical protein